jgi:hypothetical protein
VRQTQVVLQEPHITGVTLEPVTQHEQMHSTIQESLSDQTYMSCLG